MMKDDFFEEIFELMVRHKNCSKIASVYKEKYYSYIPNLYIGAIGIYMKCLGLNSIVDLGCGEAFGVLSLKNKLGFKVGGYDFNKKLLSKIPVENKNFKFKDILTLKPKDIKDYEVVYFYDPIYKKELKKIFIDNLIDIMYSGQYLMMRDDGTYITIDMLEENKNIEKISPNISYKTKIGNNYYSPKIFRKI